MTFDLPSTLPSQAVHLLIVRALLSNGFDSASHQATLTFSSVLSRYLTVLGQASLDNAQDAGRRRVGVYDVLDAIESIGGMGLGLMREVLEDDLEREEGRLLFDGMDRLAEQTRDGLSPDRTTNRFEYIPIPTGPFVSAPASPSASSSSSSPKLSNTGIKAEQEEPKRDEGGSMETDEDEGYGGSEDETMLDPTPRAIASRLEGAVVSETEDLKPNLATIKGKRKRSFAWPEEEPDDPYDAAYLPPLPGKTHNSFASNHDEIDHVTIELPTFLPSSTPAPLDSEPDSATVERELTNRRANRTQLDPYTSAPIPYASSALRYAHHAPGVGTGFRDRSSGPRLPIRPLVPDTLGALVKAYNSAKIAAKDPPQSMSARSYRATVADIVSHTTGHPSPFILAAGTLQIPGSSKDHTGTIPKGTPFVPSYPVYASTGEPVNAEHERDHRRPEVYPTSRLGIKTEGTYPPTLALSLQPSPRQLDPSKPSLLETILTEFPGHADPKREKYPFPRSSWLKPSLLANSTRITPPTALRVDSARAVEEGLNEGDLALYGEPVRAPGQPDPEGKAAKRAREKKKLKEKGLVGVPKIRFTINEPSTATPGTGGETVGPDGQPIGADKVEEKDEIVLRATWPISEDRGDWQTQLELPNEDAKSTGNLIAYGWGKRPLSVSSSTPVEPDMIGQRLGGIVKHPKIEVPTFAPPNRAESQHRDLPPPIRRQSSSFFSANHAINEVPPPVPKFKFKIKTPVTETPSLPGTPRAPPGSMLPPMTPTPGQEYRGDPIAGNQTSSTYSRAPSIKLKLPSRPNTQTSPSPGA